MNLRGATTCALVLMLAVSSPAVGADPPSGSGPHTDHGSQAMGKADDDVFGVDFPPVSPGGERSGPIDPEFVKACLSTLDNMSAVKPIKIGPHVVTESSTWGPVFRTRVTFAGAPAPDVPIRYVCWRQKNGQVASMFVVGQEAPALSAKPTN